MKTKKILTIFGIFIFFCSFFVWPINQVWSATAGPNSPGTNANDSSVGTVTWTNRDNDKTSNNQYATTGNMDDGNTTVYLKATNFGFAIPAGVTIDGISVNVERKAGDANFFDNAIRIVKGGTIGMTDKSSGSAWPTNDGTVTYGGAADLWGQSWTDTDINSANFGFAISAKKVGGNKNKKPSIDWINITVTYHTPPTPTPIPPENTPTPIPTPTPTPTPTPVPTATDTPTPAPTATPTPIQACGNGVCEASIGESCSVCAADCGACPTTTPTLTPTPVPAATDTPTPAETSTPTSEPGATGTPTPTTTEVTSAPGETSTPTPTTTETSTSTTTSTATPTPTPFIPPSVAINPINPVPQTGAKITITGTYSPGTLPVSRVEVSLDNGLIWFLPQTSGNGFIVTLENLDDGNYPVLARAIDTSDKIGQSNTQTLLIDNLPPIVGGSAFALGPQVLLPDSQGLVKVSANTPIKTALSTRGGVIKAEVKADGETFPLTTIPGTTIWTGDLVFAKAGVKNLIVTAIDGVGKTTERPIGLLLVEPNGNVINKNQQPVKDASISVFFFDPNSQSWVLWDALSYGQTNPKKVDSNGNYSFMVPAGRYFVQTDASGYKRAQSNIFDFTNTSVLNSNFVTSPSTNVLANVLPPDTSITSGKQTETKLQQDMIGKSAPDFKLATSSGEVTPASFKGKKTVLAFLATWAPNSVEQALILQKLNTLLKSDQKMLGIALQETAATTETFLRRGGYDFPVVSDQDGFTAQDYKVGVLPYYVFIDTKGIIREISSGLLTEPEILEKLNMLR